jgi:flavin reductase (DIM6/NTAB) family NADH-FMN oxidoreductase RutF
MKDTILQGVNVIAYEKDGNKYGMSCAWTTHVDYDVVLLLIGSQSDTGNNLKIGDRVGISALAKGQEDIAIHFGEKHSKSFNKFEKYKLLNDGGALLIPNSHTRMVGEVINILHPTTSPEDNMIEVKILKTDGDDNLEFLGMPDIHNL